MAAPHNRHGLPAEPTLLTVEEVADLLRTSKKAVYAMNDRRQLPGAVRIGRRLLFRGDSILQWLDGLSACA